jgi:acetyltransferase-like isoleucine patch superfamily enzyme
MPRTFRTRVRLGIRRWRLRRRGVVIHNNAVVLPSVEFRGRAIIEPYSRMSGDPRIVVGDDFYLNVFCVLLGDIEFGDHVQIGPHTVMWGRDHGMELGTPMRQQPHRKAPIRVGEDVWIGASCVILKGVTIGSGAVVGAGSVVTQDVPERAIVAGNPARVIKSR